MSIELRNGVIHYYGNPAGYVEKNTAAVDEMFSCPELTAWLNKRGLTAEWREGVYERLASGIAASPRDNPAPLKACRIWQLRDDVDVMMKFISLDELHKRFGEPEADNYRLVFEGTVSTNELEEIWTLFNTERPPGFVGHSLSMSDVVELYDHADSDFYYVDRFGFEQISFGGEEQSFGMNSMSM
ncbi:MAG: hypothetical protein LBM18_01105 [Oscillospiraceae bacterium]|jgi:hypothetical protein|nr:hypothetical protein [Oscillospiraceae bacterium]